MNALPAVTPSIVIDPVSLGMGFGLAGLTLTIVIVLLLRIGETSRALPYWAGAAFCLTVALEFRFLQDVLPPGIGLLLTNPFSVVGVALLLVGLRRVTDEPPGWRHLGLIVAASSLSSAAFVLWWPHVGARVFSQLICLAVITWFNTRLLLRVRRGYFQFPATLILTTNALLFLFFIVHGAAVIRHGAPIADVIGGAARTLVNVFIGFLIMSYLSGVLLICFAEKQTQLHRLAAHDALTGVLNRLGLRDALNVWPGAQTGAVTVFDIDRFKDINDRHGHDQGDRVLAAFAAALRAAAPPGAIIARMGGDEFCVVERISKRTGTSEPDGTWVAALCQRWPVALAAVCPAPVCDTFSHGTATFARVADEFAAALRTADQALYRKKTENGRAGARS